MSDYLSRNTGETSEERFERIAKMVGRESDTDAVFLVREIDRLRGHKRYFRAAIEHIQNWIKSGDRKDDKALQRSCLGRDIFQWITEYADHLRAENARLKAENADFRRALEMANAPTIYAANGEAIHIGFVDRALERQP